MNEHLIAAEAFADLVREELRCITDVDPSELDRVDAVRDTLTDALIAADWIIQGPAPRVEIFEVAT